GNSHSKGVSYVGESKSYIVNVGGGLCNIGVTDIKINLIGDYFIQTIQRSSLIDYYELISHRQNKEIVPDFDFEEFLNGEISDQDRTFNDAILNEEGDANDVTFGL